MPEENEYFESKKGKPKHENVPDTWDLVHLSNRLNMPFNVFKLLTILQTMSWTDGSCYPGKDKLQKIMGLRCSRSTLKNMLRQLKKKDIIKKRKRSGRGFKGNKSNIIRFNFPWPEEMGEVEPWPQKLHPKQRIKYDYEEDYI